MQMFPKLMNFKEQFLLDGRGKLINKNILRFDHLLNSYIFCRYDHFATMCELLPTGIPSLAMCLKAWLQGYSEQTHNQVAKSLGFIDHPLYLVPQPRPLPIPNNLQFPGWQVAVGIEWFLNFKTKFHAIVNSEQ